MEAALNRRELLKAFTAAAFTTLQLPAADPNAPSFVSAGVARILRRCSSKEVNAMQQADMGRARRTSSGTAWGTVFAIIIAAALLPALSLWPEGPHDGSEI